jgi:hypothetical protein
MKKLWCLLILSLLLFDCVAFAQTGVVKRSVTLRPDASRENDAIRTLKVGTRVELLDPNKTNGYFHVRAGSHEGWVWARNVEVEDLENIQSTATEPNTSSKHCIQAAAPGADRVGPSQLYPDPKKTLGCADTLTVSDLTRRYTVNCPSGKATCSYSQSHRSVSSSERDEVYDNYDVPSDRRNGRDGEVDHFYPLCAGGSNDPKNLWYQPADNEWNGKNLGFHEKDRLETYICAEIKAHRMDPHDAFGRITKDWVKFYLDEGLDSDE